MDFLIEELRFDGYLQSYEKNPDGVTFRWNRQGQSVPKQPLEFGVEARTKREDYIGNDRPLEQFFGTHLTNGPIEGKWDDRYNEEGFAKTQREAMEELVRRQNPVRISFDSISVDGIIKKATFRWLRKAICEYSLEFSPHFRDKNKRDDGRSQQTTTASNYTAQIEALALEMQALMDDSPVRYLQGTIHSEIGEAVLEALVLAQAIAVTVEQRVLSIVDNGPNSLSRLAASIESIRQKALEIRTLTSATSSATDIFFQDTTLIASFDGWTKVLGATARRMAVVAYQSAKELRSRVIPDAQALYRPNCGESLYDISNRFFGNPDAWRRIAERNGLGMMDLDGTELLIIPTLVGGA